MTNLTISQAKTKPRQQQPTYGYYFFAPYISMLAVFLIVGAVVTALGIQLQSRPIYCVGIATALYGVLTTIGWALARYIIPGNRIMVARKIISELGLRGSEQILDVGSGRGLYAIEAARQLSTGRVRGVDIWNPEKISKLTFHHKFSQPTNNTIENAQNNAALAGVAHKVDFINMDAAHLEFADESFDLVICGFVVGHLWLNQVMVLKEMRRVLKNGGRLILIDNVVDMTYFLLSTPHMFVLSYMRGRKAKRLAEKNWLTSVQTAGFKIRRYQAKKGIIVIEGQK